jgi:hypothetical protein
MKRLLLLLIFPLVLFQSCSSSDSEPVPPGSVLLKKIVQTTPQGVFTSNYTYDGYKIISSSLTTTDYISETIYTYTGDLITESVSYANSTLVARRYYIYENNRLASSLVLDYGAGIGSRVTYVDNTDGTVTSSVYSGDLLQQDIPESTNTIAFSNREAISLVQDWGASVKTNTFAYDDKNYPFKNVIGFDKIAYAGKGPFVSAINHNVIRRTNIETGGPLYTTDLQYTYNASGFPLTSTAGTNTDTVLRYYY